MQFAIVFGALGVAFLASVLFEPSRNRSSPSEPYQMPTAEGVVGPFIFDSVVAGDENWGPWLEQSLEVVASQLGYSVVPELNWGQCTSREFASSDASAKALVRGDPYQQAIKQSILEAGYATYLPRPEVTSLPEAALLMGLWGGGDVYAPRDGSEGEFIVSTWYLNTMREKPAQVLCVLSLPR